MLACLACFLFSDLINLILTCILVCSSVALFGTRINLLPDMHFPFTFLLAAINISFSRAENLPYYKNWEQRGLDWSCGDVCEESLSSIVYEDAAPSADYYVTLCSSRLRAQSIYTCMDAYCSPEEMQPGIDYLKDYCLTYTNGKWPFPPYSAFPHTQSSRKLIRAALRNETAWDELLATSKPINYTIIPYPDYYKIYFKTSVSISRET